MSRERMQIASIEAVVDQEVIESLETLGLTRSTIREQLLDQAHRAGERTLFSPLRRVDLKFGPPIGGTRKYMIDVYGNQPDVRRNVEFTAVRGGYYNS